MSRNPRKSVARKLLIDSHQNKNVPKGAFLFCIVVYGLGHTIVRLFGSEQARQRAVKGDRRNFIAVGITIHPLPPE